MSIEQVVIPDVGEATDVEVVEICVQQGDRVGKNECLVVLESEKASMEVPAPHEGVISKLGVALGDKVEQGQLIVEMETDGGGEARTGEARTGETGKEPSPEKPARREGQPSAKSKASARAEDESRGAKQAAQAGEYEVTVPEVGEAKDVKVVELLVAPGDRVEAEDALVVLESDKATMELPASRAGRIKRVSVAEGDEVFEGTLIAVLEVEGEAPRPAAETEPEPKPERERKPEPEPEEKASEAEPAERERAETPQTPEEEVYAGPAVRRLARELGVDLTRVEGQGDKGRILKEDVEAYVRAQLAGEGRAAGAGIPALPEVDFERYGPTETVPMSRIRKAGAANLHRSWLNIPHVTQHDEADVTELESFRRQHKEEGRERGVNLTPLPFIMKACCKALAEFPRFNASLSSDGASFVLKKYYHLGVAVDTEDGLVVPVIREADAKDIWQLAREIQDVAARAREGKLGFEELAGASFSVSSLGILGGTAFTPIINAPEVAILGIAKLVTRPSWNGDEFVPRQMLPLSLSYDHRANNGAEAARFVSRIAQLLGDIRLLLL